MNENPTPPSTNKYAIISLLFGILTVLSFCTAIVPIPLTGFVCYPTGFIFGAGALIYGGISLNQIKKNQEAGLPMAWLGIVSGGFVLLCILCMLVLVVTLLIFAPNYVPTMPLFQNYHL